MIGPIEKRHLPTVLQLNNEHVVETSALTMDALSAMAEEAFFALQVDRGAGGFILAFDRDASYRSPNFAWFRERYESFVYIDRVIVAADSRGRGHARTLYGMLFEAARDAGIERIACEVNVEPPNPASWALHAAMGFEPVGRATLDGGRKTVSYMIRSLAPLLADGVQSGER